MCHFLVTIRSSLVYDFIYPCLFLREGACVGNLHSFGHGDGDVGSRSSDTINGSACIDDRDGSAYYVSLIYRT